MNTFFDNSVLESTVCHAYLTVCPVNLLRWGLAAKAINFRPIWSWLGCPRSDERGIHNDIRELVDQLD